MKIHKRNNAVSGYAEYSEGVENVRIHFTEWWNGEGVDFILSWPDDETKMSLSIDALYALILIALELKITSIDELQKDLTQLNKG